MTRIIAPDCLLLGAYTKYEEVSHGGVLLSVRPLVSLGHQ
jgi:hypothetical protein